MDDNPILEEFESPYHRGEFAVATHRQYQRNPTCGDEVTLRLVFSNNRLTEAWFSAAGCMVSQAAASMLCRHIEQKSIVTLRAFQASDMLRLVGVPLTPHRQQCALLCFKALKTIVYSLENDAQNGNDSSPFIDKDE